MLTRHSACKSTTTCPARPCLQSETDRSFDPSSPAARPVPLPATAPPGPSAPDPHCASSRSANWHCRTAHHWVVDKFADKAPTVANSHHIAGASVVQAAVMRSENHRRRPLQQITALAPGGALKWLFVWVNLHEGEIEIEPPIGIDRCRVAVGGGRVTAKNDGRRNGRPINRITGIRRVLGKRNRRYDEAPANG